MNSPRNKAMVDGGIKGKKGLSFKAIIGILLAIILSILVLWIIKEQMGALMPK